MSCSGTPVHLPIALHPSTQSWRVICVRLGISRSRASVSFKGCCTSPSICSTHSAKLPAARAWYCASPGLEVPLLRNCGDRSASENSCAIDFRDAIKCCARLPSGSPTLRILGNQSVLDSLSHPAINSAPAPPATRKMNRRRSFRFCMATLHLDAIESRDHRAQVVPKPGDDHFEHVD